MSAGARCVGGVGGVGVQGFSNVCEPEGFDRPHRVARFILQHVYTGPLTCIQ